MIGFNGNPKFFTITKLEWWALPYAVRWMRSLLIYIHDDTRILTNIKSQLLSPYYCQYFHSLSYSSVTNSGRSGCLSYSWHSAANIGRDNWGHLRSHGLHHIPHRHLLIQPQSLTQLLPSCAWTSNCLLFKYPSLSLFPMLIACSYSPSYLNVIVQPYIFTLWIFPNSSDLFFMGALSLLANHCHRL